MSTLVLSVTVPFVLSVTGGSSYQEPKRGVSRCGSCQIRPLNYANTESFRFLLTQSRFVESLCSPRFWRWESDLRDPQYRVGSGQ